MKRLIPLLLICFVAFLVIAAPVSAFGIGDIFKFLLKPFHKLVIKDGDVTAKFEQIKPILQEYDKAQQEQDLTLLNKSLLDKTCCWNTITKTHNPLSLSFVDRIILTDVCYNIISAGIFNVTIDLFEATNESDKETFFKAYQQVAQHYSLACVNGFPVYKNTLRQAVIDKLNNEKKLDSGQNLISFNQIFPEALIESGTVVVPEEGGAIWWGDVRLFFYNTPADKQIMCEFTKYNCEFYTLCSSLKLEERDGYYNSKTKECLYLQADTKDEHEEIGIDVSRSELIPSMPESVKELKDAIVKGVQYDFPKIQMNKQDIYDSLNYNHVVQTVLSDYNKIGLNVEGETYTFYLKDGKVSDVTSGMDSDAQAKIFITWEELKKFINLYKNGETTEGIKALTGLNIQPWTVKVKAISKIKAVLG